MEDQAELPTTTQEEPTEIKKMPNIYSSPIDRGQAVANAVGTMQSNQIREREAPIRQGILNQQAQINQQVIGQNERAVQSDEAKLKQMDAKILQTNVAADSIALMGMDDQAMIAKTAELYPDLFSQFQENGGTPDNLRQMFKFTADRGVALGVIDAPKAAADPRSPQRKLYDEGLADRAFAESQVDAAKTANPTAKAEEITNLMTLPGMTQERAVKLAHNQIQVIADPVLGDIRIIDKTNGQMMETTDEAINEMIQNVPGDDSIREGGSLNLFSQIDETMTGATPQLQQFLQDTAGQVVDVDFLPPAVRETRQLFSMQQKDLVRALQNSPRFTEGERNAIEKEIDIAPKTWTSAASLKSRLTAVDRSLRNRLVNERRKAKSSETNSKDVKGHLLKANIIEDFLRNLNVPQGGGGASSAEDEALINKYLDL